MTAGRSTALDLDDPIEDLDFGESGRVKNIRTGEDELIAF
jgi:hypothetical protein